MTPEDNGSQIEKGGSGISDCILHRILLMLHFMHMRTKTLFVILLY